MKEYLDGLIEANGFLQSVPAEFVYLAAMLGSAVAILAVALTLFAGFGTYAERKLAGHIQDRLGPMRVGPHGLLQFIADGIKLFLKEDIIPRMADRKLFIVAPVLLFSASFASFVVVPWSESLIVSDLNIGILYMISISSLAVVGIVMAGWASNNKWSLYGAMRSAAQIVSYEVPVALSILTVVIYVGSLSTQEIVQAQAGGIHRWFLFRNPFTFMAFFLYYVAAIAEVNRIPFDLPEAESELVSGYNTEYSGMRFAFFFMSEYANMFIVSAIATLLFLGGWNGILPSPIVPGAVWFLGKALFLVFLMIWIRWTLPRLRVDQLMYVSWKVLLPLSFVAVFGSGLWLLVARSITTP